MSRGQTSMRWLMGLMIARLVFCGLTNGATAGLVRVSGAVYDAASLQPALTDQLIAALSQENALAVVDRRDIDLIFHEWSRRPFAEDPQRQAGLGRLLGIDLFVWLTLAPASGSPRLEIVEAKSGKMVISQSLPVTESNEQLIAAVVAATVKAAGNMPAGVVAGGAALVFAKPLIELASNQQRALADDFLKRLQSAAIDTGVPLLHRRYVLHAVQENLWSEKGLLDATGPKVMLQGATHLLASRMREENGAVMATFVLIDTNTGKRLAHREVVWRQTEGSSDSVVQEAVRPHQEKPVTAPLAAWIRDSIIPLPATTRGNAPAQSMSKNVTPEALADFFAGILLHNQGCYFDAVQRFAQASDKDHRFPSPIRWMQSAYRAGGFTEIDERLTKYLERNANCLNCDPFDDRRMQPATGIALLGVTVDSAEFTTLQTPVAMKLIDALHHESETTVFLPEDIAALRSEFDVLVGLNDVAGVTWQQSPALAHATTITAHLRTNSEGIVLELCRVNPVDPGQLRRARVSLPPDRSGWGKVIHEATRSVLGDFSAASTNALAPPLVRQTQDELIAQLDGQFEDATYLKLLYLDPACRNYLHRFPKTVWGRYWPPAVNFGLHEWLLRRMPADAAQRPWVELGFISRFNPTPYGWSLPEPLEQDKVEVFIDKLRAHAARYPDHPAGLMARFNTVLFDLSNSNMKTSRQEIDRVIAGLEKSPGSIHPVSLKALRDLRVLLTRALQPATSLPADVELRGFLMPGGIHSPVDAPNALAVPIYFTHPQWPASRKQEDALVTFHVYHWLLRGGTAGLPIGVVVDLLERHPKSALALAYAADSVNRLFASCDTTATVADTITLWEPFTAAVCGPLERGFIDHDHTAIERGCLAMLDPPKPVLYHAAYHTCANRAVIESLGGDSPLRRGLLTNQLFVACQSRVRQALQEALRAKRISLGTDNLLRKFLADDTLDANYEKELHRQADAAWTRGVANPTTEDWLAWREYRNWKRARLNPTEQVAFLTPYAKRLHERYDDAPKIKPVVELYCQFANTFFQCGQYEIAQALIDQVFGWPDLSAQQLAPEIRVHLQYLRALMYQRDGDRPAAFRLAKTALGLIESTPSREGYWLLTDIGINERSGSGGPLQVILTDYIAQLRDNPNAPFEDPFAAASAKGFLRKPAAP